MQIKICGLRRKEDIDYVNQFMPDYIGFVFAGKRRKIDFETAVELKRGLHPQIKAVGVFVNAELSFVVKLVIDGVLDVIQLHGDEEEPYIQKLREQIKVYGREDIPIVKAVRVQSEQQIKEAQKLPVDALLLDAFRQEEYGGSGKVFDHNLIPKLQKPYVLAGGITEKNVIDILEKLKRQGKTPSCIDVSSSVETNEYKDKQKIERIVKLVHSMK